MKEKARLSSFIAKSADRIIVSNKRQMEEKIEVEKKGETAGEVRLGGKCVFFKVHLFTALIIY